MDCSVHAFACPVAPSRVVKHWPKARFVVCLREPRRRTISHWGMVLDTEEDNQNGADWSDFASAWRDERLSCDTLYGSCMERWLGNFSRDRFLLIDSGRMRNESRAVLAEILEHLGMDAYDFDMTEVHNANTAMDRRPLTLFGRGFRFAAALIPGFLKQPLVSSLQGKGVNVYKLPIISKARPTRAVPTPEQCVEMNDEVTGDIEKLERITSFPVKQWLDSAQ
ncbi:MAG: sulfotransferase domain-containing protein [Candidatus Poseidoniales archaeon]|nr:sulfotransferase domain-containing protein [Candidatus Poseidoniales archaeon]